jgi:hypothetical protein
MGINSVATPGGSFHIADSVGSAKYSLKATVPSRNPYTFVPDGGTKVETYYFDNAADLKAAQAAFAGRNSTDVFVRTPDTRASGGNPVINFQKVPQGPTVNFNG